MSSTHDCGGDAAAYVLGALEPRELEAFRTHLLQCALCRDDVQMLGGVVQMLPLATPQYEAPRGLRGRVMREVRSENSSKRRSLSSVLGVARARVVAGGVAVVAAVGVLTGIELTAGAAGLVVTARLSPGVSGSAQLRVDQGRAELVVRHLTPPGRGHVYEVWLQSGSAAPVPASVLFGVDSSGNADVGIPRGLRRVSAVMVTPEPYGGSPKPTHVPVIVARLA